MALPGIMFGVLHRLCSRGLLNFWETVLRYFLKSAPPPPPPPLCDGSVEEMLEASAAADGAAAVAELGGLEEEDRAANRDPGGSDRALLKGFLLDPAVLLSALPPSPVLPLDEFLSPLSSLRALRQFCILLHLLVEAF